MEGWENFRILAIVQHTWYRMWSTGIRMNGAQPSYSGWHCLSTSSSLVAVLSLVEIRREGSEGKLLYLSFGCHWLWLHQLLSLLPYAHLCAPPLSTGRFSRRTATVINGSWGKTWPYLWAAPISFSEASARELPWGSCPVSWVLNNDNHYGMLLLTYPS